MGLARLSFFKFLSVLICLGLSAAALPATTQAADGKDPVLKVVIEEIRSPRGRIHVGVWSSAESFGDAESRVAGSSAEVTGANQTLVFEGLAPGSYAIAAYHDENDNGEFDRTWIGLPDEGLGFSNGAWISIFGAPSFESAAIELRGPATRAVITLRY